MNLTQTDLANLLHVKKGTISRWERGLWPIPADKEELFFLKIFSERYKIIPMRFKSLDQVWEIIDGPVEIE